jgi:hypothetical protein
MAEREWSDCDDEADRTRLCPVKLAPEGGDDDDPLVWAKWYAAGAVQHEASLEVMAVPFHGSLLMDTEHGDGWRGPPADMPDSDDDDPTLQRDGRRDADCPPMILHRWSFAHAMNVKAKLLTIGKYYIRGRRPTEL